MTWNAIFYTLISVSDIMLDFVHTLPTLIVSYSIYECNFDLNSLTLIKIVFQVVKWCFRYSEEVYQLESMDCVRMEYWILSQTLIVA